MIVFRKDLDEPSPKEIIAVRKSAGISQAEAANLVNASCRAWQFWEAGDRRMNKAAWELFLTKLGAVNA